MEFLIGRALANNLTNLLLDPLWAAACREKGLDPQEIVDALLRHDHDLHLADLAAYAAAHQRLAELYADEDAWARKAILNVAGSGTFSSDRTIRDYAREIWRVMPCPPPRT